MGSKGQSQTQQVRPPSYAMPYLNMGLSEAARMYNGGQVQSRTSGPGALQDRLSGGTMGFPGGFTSGQTPPGGVTGGEIIGLGKQQPPFTSGQTPTGGVTGGSVITNPYQEAGNQIAYNRAVGGDPTIDAARGYVQNSLAGGFLNSNPYLDQTFNRAAQATQGQLASQFAGAGRNVDQSQGLRAQQLNDLASQIYGGNYANERNLMQGTLAAAQPLGNQAYTDAAQVGNLQRPEETALDNYLRRVNAGTYGSNSTTSGGGGFSGSGAVGGGLAAYGAGLSSPWILGAGLLGGLF
jgi:hypothetical protein